MSDEEGNPPLSPSQELFLGLISKEMTSSDEEDMASIPVTEEQQKQACTVSKCFVRLDSRNLYQKLEEKVLKKFPKAVNREPSFKNKLVLRTLNSKTKSYYFPIYDQWEENYKNNKRRIWRRNKIRLLSYFQRINRSDEKEPDDNSASLNTMSFSTQDLVNYNDSEHSETNAIETDSSQVLFDFVEESEDQTPTLSTQGHDYSHFNEQLDERTAVNSQPTTSTQKHVVN